MHRGLRKWPAMEYGQRPTKSVRCKPPCRSSFRSPKRNGRSIGTPALVFRNCGSSPRATKRLAQYRDHLPEAFDYRNFERDAVCTANLADLLKAVDVLRNAVHDTLLATANRATTAAQSVYGYIQVGSLTLERLKRRGNTRTSHAAAGRQAKAEMPSGETPAAASGIAPSAAPSPPSGTAPPVKVEPPSAQAAPKAEVA